jgi:hypothetical protein
MSDLVSISNAAADAAGIPRILLLACGCAESGLDPFSRRPASPADDERYWPDVSGGVWQQTVRWDPDYHGGAAYPGPDEVARVLALQFDPERSARVAAANLAPKWRQYQPDVFATLCAYNWPAGGGQPKGPAQAANYRRGIAEAQALLGTTGDGHADTGGNPDSGGTMLADPWTRTELTNGSAVSTPAEWYTPIPTPRPIRSIVWHDMEGYLAGAIATWNQGAASAHLCVLRDGTIVRTVEIENIAWHAGTDAATGRTAFWKAHNINPYSIGVELEGFTTSGYTPEQVAACVAIGRWALARYGIQPVRGGDGLDGHHLHSEISNQRSDPGPLFPFDAILSAIKESPTMPDETVASNEAYAQPGQVGSGILEMMAEDGTVPALPSIFHPLGSSPSVAEECVGMNGRRYLFHIPTGRRWRYDPAA